MIRSNRQVSVVPQEPYLFSGSTVAENIRYNRDGVTDEQIEKAAKAVGAHDFITDLEQGYDTPPAGARGEPQHRPAPAH